MTQKFTLKNSWKTFKKFWNYVWNGDDYKSLVLSIVIAFILIKFVFYPVVGFTLSTTHPIVAIVSGSMEHKITSNDGTISNICGKQFTENKKITLDDFWTLCGSWYETMNVTKAEFESFPFKNGMNIGDIIILRNPGENKIKIGDVIVFIQEKNPSKEPIIHRVVNIYTKDNQIYFQTKGDHNPTSINLTSKNKYLNEYEVSGKELVGKSIIRIPYLGYVKILVYKGVMWVVNLVR